MKVLVTGAAGFIGSNLVGKLILDGFDCIGVDIYDSPLYRDDSTLALGHFEKKVSRSPDSRLDSDGDPKSER